MCRHHLLVPALVVLAMMRGSAQVIPVNGAPTGPRTALVVGQVLDPSTGTPVPEAIVRLSMPKFTESLPTTPKGRVMADGEGRFFFTDLPAGDYYLSASKDGYAAGVYGQRRYMGPTESFVLREGERRLDVTLPVWKYAVIAGRVVDEVGEPVVGVSVRALIRKTVAGRAQFGEQSFNVPSTTTDDRGQFRFANVPPATYAIVAPSMQTTVPVSVLKGWDATELRNELFFSGIYEMSPLGQPRTQQVGDFALMTLNTVQIPPPMSPDGPPSVYRTTYFPSATTASAAMPITVRPGEERTDLALTLQPVPAVRVSGRVVAPDGSTPPSIALRLEGDSRIDVITPSLPSGLAEIGFETATCISDAAGRFTLLGVPPGQYVLTHANSFLSDAVRQGRPGYWVSQRITVGSSDVPDLVVNLRAPLRVEGRLEFRGITPQTLPEVLLMRSVSFETAGGEPGGFTARSGDSTSMSISGITSGGQYIARPLEANGWFMQSVTLDGKDITDRVFDLQADTASLVVTYTDRAQKVSGTVRDVRGAASATAMVLAFPVDSQRWINNGRYPRLLKNVTTSRAGVYTFDNLPAGEYHVIALESAEAEDWKDPKILESLAARATKITVAAGDAAKTLDLSLKTIR